jgi:hypothetical protein
MYTEIQEVLGVDCRDAEIHIVRLACSEEPLRLLEQLTVHGLQEFEEYCRHLAKQSFNLYVVTEQHTADPAEVSPWLSGYLPCDQQWIKPGAVAYLEPFEQLGITHLYRRAGALALNKAHQIQAKELTRQLHRELQKLGEQLTDIQLQAARLHLALSSSIYSHAGNF